MKKYDYIQLGMIALLSHFAQCALFLLLFAALGGTGTTSSFTFASPAGLVIGAIYPALVSFLFGWGLRPKSGIDKNRCWNAAIVLYVLDLASLLLMPVPFSPGNILVMLWQLPMAPAMVAVNELSGDSSALNHVFFALLAAIEPMCLTLGLLWKGKKQPASRKSENSDRTSADAGAAILNEENKTNE